MRNNNPFNLVKTAVKWQGEVNSTDATFEQFETLEQGVLAGYKNLLKQISKGRNTLEKLMHVYAPPHENNTVAYISFLSKKIGISKDAVMSPTHYPFIAYAIMEYENGKKILNQTLDFNAFSRIISG